MKFLVTSPVGSRPPSPVLSDSELEVPQRNSVKPEEQRWEWGQLPTNSSLDSERINKLDEQNTLENSIKSSETETNSKSGNSQILSCIQQKM